MSRVVASAEWRGGGPLSPAKDCGDKGAFVDLWLDDGTRLEECLECGAVVNVSEELRIEAERAKGEP